MLPKKENIKCQFPFFNSGSTSRSVLALNTVDFEVLVNYKVLDLQVLSFSQKKKKKKKSSSPLSVAIRIKSIQYWSKRI